MIQIQPIAKEEKRELTCKGDNPNDIQGS